MNYCICVPIGFEIGIPVGMLIAAAIIYCMIRIVKAVHDDDD